MPDMQIIARIHTQLPEKFGVPRQSGLVPELRGRIIFEPAYRSEAAVRGLEGFSHVWLIWQFDRAVRKDWSPTVRPPRLGGNVRLGVFATRSPFRPNPIGLSCVELERVELDSAEGPVLHVRGTDLVDGTPILDIKPYLSYCDCHPEATGGFTDGLGDRRLTVDFPTEWMERVTPEAREGLMGVLASDPRPRYQDDPEREYGLAFARWNIRFRVSGGTLIVCRVEERGDQPE